MQQAVNSRNDPESILTATATAPACRGGFVINLCSATTPAALNVPKQAVLPGFEFFVSRRREEGRERFRLHMGFFESQEAAEQLLDRVREVYPAAWAGVAPSVRSPGTSAPARGAAPAVAATAEAATTPAPAVLAASPPLAPPRDPVPVPDGAGGAGQPSAPGAHPSRPAPVSVAAVASGTKGPRPVQQAAQAEGQSTAGALRSVREAIAALEDAEAAAVPTLAAVPVLKPARLGVPTVRAVSAASARPEAAAPRVRGAGTAGPQVIAVPKAPAARAAVPAARPAASVPKAAVRAQVAPKKSHSRALDGDATLRLLESAAPQTRPAAPADQPCFAVQLMWSVQPIDVAKVPMLAIFNAYTLYGAEGNRGGRRWYGLRLGFFGDAVSARQVALYVRPEFANVSVVPVTERERARAKLAATRPPEPAVSSGQATAAPATLNGRTTSEFTFIDEPAGKAARAVSTPPAALRGRAARETSGRREKARIRASGQVYGNERAAPLTLEQTLEILGANQLALDDGSSASINDTGVRHLHLETVGRKPTRLGRLIERLSERRGG